jgi:CHAT domain-containing protein/tetratricopeptide (TPR) repeat protein
MLVQPIEETRKAVHTWQHVVLSDSFEQLLGFLLQQANGRGDAEAAGLIADRRDLIASCRDIGIDPTFDLLAFVLGNPRAFNQIMVSFINAPTWTETKRLVEAQRQTLLSVFADQFIAHLLTQYPPGTPQHPRLQEHRELLARCRREGIEAAFADRVPPPVPASVTPELVERWLAISSRPERDAFLAQHPELDPVLQRLQRFEPLMREALQLNQPHDLPQKAELLRAALTLADESRWRAGSAMAHFELGRAYTEPQLGDQDAAIAHFEAALEIYTRERSPKDWGDTQNNLGIVYFQRADGDRRDNLRQAIVHFEASLEVRDRETTPFDWAQTQQNLGGIYANYTFENPAEQLDRAIAYYQSALEVYTREAYPADRARTQFNLGLAFGDRHAGDRAENLEQALVCLQQALEVETRRTTPTSWALGQAELGWMYTRRIRGDQAENLERAIDCLSHALEVYTRELFPLEWAKTQERLAQAYRRQTAGVRADNLEQAGKCLRRALEVHTASATPARRASLQFELMSVYAERFQAARADALGAAIVELVNIRSADALNQVTDAHAEVLLTDEAAQALASLAGEARAQGDEEVALLLEEHQGLLIQQRGPALMALLNQINTSRESTDFARRARDCRTALGLVDRARSGGQEIWAYLHSSLGDALSRSWDSDRAENLEQALGHLQLALEVYTRETNPQEWADAHARLGIVYYNRIRGERAENLEQAIAHNMQALEVFTHADSPERWASIQANLGNNYHQRAHGTLTENLEQALSYLQQALEVYTSDAFPEEWALVQQGLGQMYHERIRGERAENMEQAIIHLQQALLIYKPPAFATDWAETHLRLGDVQLYRIYGNRNANIQQAIEHYQQALEVYIRNPSAADHRRSARVQRRPASPMDWAIVQSRLGMAYSKFMVGDRTEHIQQAIAHFQRALEVCTPENALKLWKSIQLGLGNALRNRDEDRATIDQAIACYQGVLAADRDQSPEIWAIAHNNLGSIYTGLIGDQRADYHQLAVAHYEQVLAQCGADIYPQLNLDARLGIARAHFAARDWAAALPAWEQAIALGDDMLDTAYTTIGRQSEAGTVAEAYRGAAYCLLRLGRPAEALLAVERGKTRLLNQTLAMVDGKMVPSSGTTLYLPPMFYYRAQEARQRIRQLEGWLNDAPNVALLHQRTDLDPAQPLDELARTRRQLGAALHQARADYRQLVEEIRQWDAFFVPADLDIETILELIPSDGALVAPLLTSQGSAVFVLPHGLKALTDEQVLWLDELTDADIHFLRAGDLGALLDEERPVATQRPLSWLLAYLTAQHRESPETQATWRAATAAVTRRLWDMIMGPIHARLAEQRATRVVLLPPGNLQVLPLHAAWREVDGVQQAFLDDCEVCYAPSLYALNACKRRQSVRERERIGLVAGIAEYPRLTPLPNARFEAHLVAGLLGAQPLLDADVTSEALIERSPSSAYLHLACHAAYAWIGDPLDSALILAGEQRLTLAQMLASLDLQSARLVTLSACETGVVDTQRGSDELIGLPAGLLQAGAPGVVSSLWAVGDLSTVLLMERFYIDHLGGTSAPAALRQAQIWLRGATARELAERFAIERAKPDEQRQMPY